MRIISVSKKSHKISLKALIITEKSCACDASIYSANNGDDSGPYGADYNDRRTGGDDHHHTYSHYDYYGGYIAPAPDTAADYVASAYRGATCTAACSIDSDYATCVSCCTCCCGGDTSNPDLYADANNSTCIPKTATKPRGGD